MKSILKYSVFVLLICCCANAFSEDVNTLFKRAQFYEKINEDSAKYYYNQVIQVKSESEIYGKALRKIALLNATVKKKPRILICANKQLQSFKK